MTSIFDNLDVDLLPSIRLQNRRNAERLGLALPTCPFCSELNFPGVARCGELLCAPVRKARAGAVAGPTGGAPGCVSNPARPDTSMSHLPCRV